MTLAARIILLIQAIGADIKARPVRGYRVVTTSAVIDPSVTQFVSVNNGSAAVTITLDSSKASVYTPVWVKRFDGTSTGNISIVATSGTVQSSGGGLLGVVIMLLTSPRQYGYTFNGTNWELISQ